MTGAVERGLLHGYSIYKRPDLCIMPVRGEVYLVGVLVTAIVVRCIHAPIFKGGGWLAGREAPATPGGRVTRYPSQYFFDF